MDALKALRSIQCELQIMSAKNVQVTNSKGHLFVRCYLSAGNNKRVRFDSREVSPNGDFSWNETCSLDCVGTNQSMDMIIHGKIVLELRSRNTGALFGGSQLLGTAEVSWRDVFESSNMELERWVMMKSNKKGVKTPCVRISMKIDVTNDHVGLVERKRTNKREESCGCCVRDCCDNTCVDSELFVIGVAVDAF